MLVAIGPNRIEELARGGGEAGSARRDDESVMGLDFAPKPASTLTSKKSTTRSAGGLQQDLYRGL